MTGIVETGQRAFTERAFSHMITADVAFHRSVVEAAGSSRQRPETGLR